MCYKRKYDSYSFVEPDETFMEYGFECGEGWYPIIFEAFDKMQTFLNKFRNRKLKKILRVVQVKEKYAELRIYCNTEPEEIWQIISEAMDKSRITCEWCGTTENVKVRNNRMWLTTLCDSCEIKRNANR